MTERLRSLLFAPALPSMRPQQNRCGGGKGASTVLHSFVEQLRVVNRVFSPGAAEIAVAERVVAAFAAAEAGGSAAVQRDG